MIKNQHRFFVLSIIFKNQRVIVSDKNLIHQVGRVLRLKIGEQIVLLDNSGDEYLINLEKINQQIEGFIVKKVKNKSEPAKKIILCQSLLKHDKFEQVLKFGTSLGIVGFITLIAQNSVVKKINPHKIDRYQKIIRESAEQSGRGILPKLEKSMNFQELVNFLKDKECLKLIAWEKEQNKKLADFNQQIKENKKIYLVVGPEGGFTKTEVKNAQKAGFQPFSLGKLIFRAEIAGLVASALILN